MIPRRRFNEEKARMQSQQVQMQKEHQSEMEASEKTIIQLEKEKLEAEIEHKNQELASVTMHLVQKNEVLHRLEKELKTLSQHTPTPSNKKQIGQLVKMIDTNAHLDEDWEQFAFRFDQVHRNFFTRIKAQYPGLTPKDHRLCAYLRLNLSTKEIAPLMNISVRGVEISRYRLRRKLELDNAINLTEFLMSF